MRRVVRRAARLAFPTVAAFGIAVAGLQAAHAQTPRRWVDPPPGLGEGAQPHQTPPASPAPGPGAAPPSQLDSPPGASSQTAQPRQAPAEPSRTLDAAPPGRAVAPPDARPSAAAPQPPAGPTTRSAQPQPPASAALPARPEWPASAERGRAPGDRRSRVASREEAVRDLVSDYLDVWSAPNPLTLAGSAEFYAPNVIFHGRSMSARALLEEKRRFVQRWPERRYRARRDTIGVACGPGGETCTVRSVFDFLAIDPERGRRSQGVATLELVVSFAEDDRPVITAENSLVHGRTRGGGPALEDAADAP